MRDIAEVKFPCPVCGNEMKFNVPASDVRSVHITNADRLRSMTDEELAEWIADNAANHGGGCCAPGCYDCSTHPDGCAKPWLDWLRKEASNGET